MSRGKWPVVAVCILMVASLLGMAGIVLLGGHIDTVAACQSGDVLKLRDVEIQLINHSLTVARSVYADPKLLKAATNEAAYQIHLLKSVHC